MPFAKDHPLQMPEVCLHISRFVTPRNATLYARVCKAWSDSFTSVVWHTVDFDAQERFINVDPSTVKKHGYCIRNVKGISDVRNLMVLQHPSVCKLSALSIVMPAKASPAYCGDLLRQNAASITFLDISAVIQEGGLLSLAFPFDVVFLPPKFSQPRGSRF
jgi:hypothetical protein